MRSLLVLTLVATALWPLGCESEHDEFDHVTGQLPITIPEIAYEALAREGEGARLFEVVGVTWPNGCLGVANARFACTQAVVPGYRVLVENRGWLVEYHTDTTRTVLRIGPAGRIEDHPAVAVQTSR